MIWISKQCGVQTIACVSLHQCFPHYREKLLLLTLGSSYKIEKENKKDVTRQPQMTKLEEQTSTQGVLKTSNNLAH